MKILLKYIVAVAVAFAGFTATCHAQFKEEAFQQTYNEEGTYNPADTADRLFSFKEYIGGLTHKNTIKPGVMFAGSVVLPGTAQIYNKDYWKLPIVYGGFLGCAYALNWNNQMYSDYSQAYLDIMDDDPGTASYEDFLPPRYNVEANRDYLERVFKNRKDNYRRQRDLSIFCFIGVYLLSVIDAYVDAELSNFDISNDLSVQLRPTTLDYKRDNICNHAYGLQCSISF